MGNRKFLLSLWWNSFSSLEDTQQVLCKDVIDFVLGLLDMPYWRNLCMFLFYECNSLHEVCIFALFLVFLGGGGAVLLLELRASHLLGRCSTTWAALSDLFCVGYFQDRVSWTICPGWLLTSVLLISVSWVAEITCVSHWHLASFNFFSLS
jgi:hypothetical protein